jgi:hypothetical protein
LTGLFCAVSVMPNKKKRLQCASKRTIRRHALERTLTEMRENDENNPPSVGRGRYFQDSSSSSTSDTDTDITILSPNEKDVVSTSSANSYGRSPSSEHEYYCYSSEGVSDNSYNPEFVVENNDQYTFEDNLPFIPFENQSHQKTKKCPLHIVGRLTPRIRRI